MFLAYQIIDGLPNKELDHVGELARDGEIRYNIARTWQLLYEMKNQLYL